MTVRRASYGVAALALAAACTAGPANLGSGAGSGGGTTSGSIVVPPPVLNPIPSFTSLGTVALSGSVAEGNPVAISVNNGAKTITASVLPGGHFCADVPLVAGAQNNIDAYALYQGVQSAPATAQTTQSATASAPMPATCSGEQFGDGGLDCSQPQAALCDYACNSCIDDAYIPNQSPQSAPDLPPGTYDLDICPCDDDWFSLVAPQDGDIEATLVVDPSVEMGLELRVPLGLDGGGSVLASATTQQGMAEITFLSTAASLYDLHIFAQPDGGGSYQLTLNDYTTPIDAGPMVDAGPPDSGFVVYGPCTNGPGLDNNECNPLTPYCDINDDAGYQCVAGPSGTVGQFCTEDQDCNFGLIGSQVVCVGNSCTSGRCHSTSDCPSGETCDETAGACG